MIWPSVLLIFIGFYSLFFISKKQINKTKQSPFAFLLKAPQLTRIASFLILLLAMYLNVHDAHSIGFVSFWIFATPVIFLIILKNTSFQKKKNHK